MCFTYWLQISLTDYHTTLLASFHYLSSQCILAIQAAVRLSQWELANMYGHGAIMLINITWSTCWKSCDDIMSQAKCRKYFLTPTVLTLKYMKSGCPSSKPLMYLSDSSPIRHGTYSVSFTMYSDNSRAMVISRCPELKTQTSSTAATASHSYPTLSHFLEWHSAVHTVIMSNYYEDWQLLFLDMSS